MAPQPQDDKSDRPSGDGGTSREQERRPSKAWGIIIFGLIGATTATFAITQVRRSVDWFYTQTAFRTKAMEVHPDQNQDDREAAEEKFKEVVKSYEAIKLERKNGGN
nr:unnamed protein product [Digitaria exilis]